MAYLALLAAVLVAALPASTAVTAVRGLVQPRLLPLHLERCPRHPVDFVPSLDDAIKAIRTLRIRGHFVVAQGRVNLTPQNSPVYTAFSIYASPLPGAERYRTLINRRCGIRTVRASWFFDLSLPTLLAGRGDHPYVVTKTQTGWTVIAEAHKHA